MVKVVVYYDIACIHIVYDCTVWYVILLHAVRKSLTCSAVLLHVSKRIKFAVSGRDNSDLPNYGPNA